MPYQFDIASLTNSELWNNEELTIYNKNHHLQPRQQQPPSSLISNLSSLFITTVSYHNLTKQEALEAIGYFLYEYDDLIHSQLLDCFIRHQFLLYNRNDTSYFTINYHANMNGIFTPLTKCYSLSCQLNNITCYSPLCPNKRMSSLLHLVNHHHEEYNNQNQQTKEYCYNREQNNTPRDWITSIPNHIRNSTNRKELKRQAGIAELLLTEQNYCQDLDILHRIYVIPLLESSEVIGNPSRRQRFYNNVFGNYLDITHLHHSFYNQLTSHNRQSSFFIGRVGTIIMQHVTNLIEPYIQYASNHIRAIYCMTMEHKNNLQFAKFLSTQNALKCTRRLGLRHYLTSPTLWIGKLKLMVEAILKNTVDDADQLSLKASLAILHDTLCRMNSSTNLSPEDFRFEELSISIYTISGAELQLLVIPDGSALIREEALWLARSTHPLQPSLCHVFLFSHALILTHPRVSNGRTEYIVIAGSPIPIQLLSIDNRNVATSMIRRLSFASTSMVSTPIHLINNLRRQKSMNSEISSHSNNTSNSSHSSSSGRLHRSNTVINIAPSNTTKLAQQSPTTISADCKNRVLLPFRIKTKLKKLKSNFRWSTSFSVPASPTTNVTEETAAVVSRRDSAPALLKSYNNQQVVVDDESLKKTQQQKQRRTLKISHMAYPENAFKLEFLSRSDRLIWENFMKEVMMNSDKSNHFFKIKMICKSLSSPSSPTTIIPKTAVGNNVIIGGRSNIGRIRCAYAFAYINNNNHKSNMVALGTQCGVWIGPRDGSRPFQLVLPDKDVHQLCVLQDKLVVLTHDNKQHSLIAYNLKPIIHEEPLDWCVVKRSSVICFTVGKVRNQYVIIYLTKRLQTTWLAIIVPNQTGAIISNQKPHWFKKYRMEYKVTTKDPTDIQIIHDSVFIRSDRNGIERVDISSSASAATTSSTDNNVTTASKNIFSGPNVGLLSFKNGFVCDSQYAYSVSLFDDHPQNNRRLLRTKFESQVNSIAVVYPYLVAFSSFVIEIKNIETTELVQAIRGNQIQFISITNDPTQPLFFTMMSKDRTTTSIYQLQLSL